MSGYSKMEESTPELSPKWRSRSTRHLSSPPHPTVKKTQEDPMPNNTNSVNLGAILSRTRSSVSHRYRPPEKSNGNLPGTLRRAFSTRKSSSVADSYCRIHDTCNNNNDNDDGDDYNGNGRSPAAEKGRSSGRKSGKILRACKRLFGIKPKNPADV